MAPNKQKRTGAHFTPKELAGLVAERLLKQFKRFNHPVRVLDPACGDGNLLVAMARNLPPDVLQRCTLIGIENDRDSYQKLTRLFSNVGALATDLILGDFLDFVDDGTIFGKSRSIDPFDVVIANPPYVRTQVLGAKRSQQLSVRFGLAGRVDLYQAFLVGMADVLRPGGVLGVITSNRFLTTKAGASTRRFLRSQFDLLEVIDLGDTKLFAAAVLPALIFGVKRENLRDGKDVMSTAFVRVYSTPKDSALAESASSVPEILRKPKSGLYKVGETTFEVATGRFEAPIDDSVPWTLHTYEESDWVRRVIEASQCQVGDVARVRVGIKTTADNVFIRSDWAQLPAEIRPEGRYLKPLLSHRNAQRWHAQFDEDRPLKVLYTHEVVDHKRRAISFPENSAAWRYLLGHRRQLESRKYVLDAGRNWYEIWVSQDPSAWSLPKIVFPDISPDGRFFLERASNIVDGNCYWITTNDTEDEELLLLILGVANSSVLARYHELCFQNKLYARRRRYLTQYVQQYPLPTRSLHECDEIIRIVRALLELPPSSHEQAGLEQRLDTCVAEAFNISTASLTPVLG